MRPVTTSDILLAELRLPFGFEAVDPSNPPEIEEADLRVEIVDLAGVIRRWELSGLAGLIPWHEAAGWRIAPDGIAQPCDGCGRLTRVGYYDGPPSAPTRDRQFNPLCPSCDSEGYDG